MDIKAIVDSCGFENEKSKQDLERWLNSIVHLLKGKDIKKALSDEQTLCKMLQVQKNSGTSGQNYSKNKRYVSALQVFFGIPLTVPSRETVLKKNPQTCLYKNLNSLLDFVDKVGKSAFQDYSNNEDLLNVKSIAILGWHGLSLSDVSALKKEQLYSSGEVCMASGVLIDRKFFAILQKFAATDEYRGLPSGKLQKFKSDAKYLFRSTTNERLLTKLHLADILRRFNNMADSFHGAIIFRNLRENALFEKIAKEMPLKSISHKIEEVFVCDIKTAYRKQVEFLHWYNNIYLV